MLTFTPLYGANSASAASASLLELDGGAKILVDIGWDAAFDATQLGAIEKHVSTLSVVLLTHATVEHLGAFAHACKHVPGFRKIPVYATIPVANLGRSVLADMYASTPLAASTIPQDSINGGNDASNLLLQPPTAEEITAYCAAITPLKYSQPHQPIPSPFSPSISGLTITAYSAGHSLGGTIWHIQHGLESIVYASDWNLGRENFFPGAAWLSSGNEINEPLSRPSTLICSSRGAVRKDVLTRKGRDERMISLIRETIAQGGKVLIPTDSSARVLELGFLLNRIWRDNMDGPHAEIYKSARIYMASKSGGANKRNLQSMLEWMDEAVIRDAEAARDADAGGGKGGKGQGRVQNPLEWKHVRLVERKSQMQRALARTKPCVFLASDAKAEWGFSNDALRELATDPRNCVILTEKLSEVQGGKPSMARQLWDVLAGQDGQSSQSGAKVVSADGRTVELRDVTTSPLESDEQSLYQQYLARQHQLHSALLGDNTVNDVGAAAVADDQASESSESSDEDEDTQHQGRALNLSAQMTHKKRTEGMLSDAELGINILLRKKNAVHDFDVRNKRGREKMYPFVAHRARDDEYGEVIRPEEYLRAEERDDVNGVDMKQENTGVGQKRKWGEDGGAKGRGRGPQNKKQKNEPAPPPKPREPDDIDALIAKATGEALGNAKANGTAAAEVESSAEDEESDYEPEEASTEGPQKATFTAQTLELRCKIAHVDFCGLYRLTDLQGLIPRIRPRKLIIMAGDEVETKAVADACRELSEREQGSVGEIFTPVTGESIDASVDTHAWTLKLSRALVKRLAWKELEKGGGLSIASISGRLGLEEPASEIKAEDDDSGSKKKPRLDLPPTNPEPVLPVLDTLPPTHPQTSKAAAPIHVGDLRLHDIRSQLTANGHTAEFRGQGALLIDGTVVVRKNLVTGGLEVETGTAGWGLPQWRTRENSGSFWAVRGVVYGGLGSV